MQAGDAFCTSEDDFDGYMARPVTQSVPGRTATDTCRTIAKPTKVAILRGTAGRKTMVRIMGGANAYEIGWTNGKLPVR